MNKSQLKQIVKEVLSEVSDTAVAPKYQIGNVIDIGFAKLSISKIDGFGGTKHYGFYGNSSDGKSFSGWIPVIMLDNMNVKKQ